MERLRPFIHILLSSFLAYQSYKLFSQSFLYQEKIPTTISILLAFVCNLFVTGTFAFVGFSFPTSRLLPKRYYLITKPKFIERIYRALGVKYFRFFLLTTVWRSKEKQKTFFNGTKTGLEHFLHSSNQSEFGHLGAFVFIQYYALVMGSKGELELLIYCSVINFLFNFYPVILQRKHRIRIQRILKNN